MDYIGLEKMMEERLSNRRWLHSQGVANTAKELAVHYGLDSKKAYLAGLLHDYAKEIPHAEQIEYAKQNLAYRIVREDLENPKVLHALVGASLVKKDLGIEDSEVLTAIRYHTVGNENMSDLDKVVYLADLIEPNRNCQGTEEIKKMAFEDLDQALLISFDHTIAYLISKGEIIHPDVLQARNSLIRNKGKK